MVGEEGWVWAYCILWCVDALVRGGAVICIELWGVAFVLTSWK